MVSLIHMLPSMFTFDITMNLFFSSHAILKAWNFAAVNAFSLHPLELYGDVVIIHAGSSSYTNPSCISLTLLHIDRKCFTSLT